MISLNISFIRGQCLPVEERIQIIRFGLNFRIKNTAMMVTSHIPTEMIDSGPCLWYLLPGWLILLTNFSSKLFFSVSWLQLLRAPMINSWNKKLSLVMHQKLLWIKKQAMLWKPLDFFKRLTWSRSLLIMKLQLQPLIQVSWRKKWLQLNKRLRMLTHQWKLWIRSRRISKSKERLIWLN